MKHNIIKKAEEWLYTNYFIKLEEANAHQLRAAIAEGLLSAIAENWHNSTLSRSAKRRVYYFSAEYLLGRMLTNNLNNLGILKEVSSLLEQRGIDISILKNLRILLWAMAVWAG